MPFLLLLMLLFSRISSAGINLSFDNAQTADERRQTFYNGYEIPYFKSAKEALDWARLVKWNEPIRRLLIRKMHNLAVVAKVLYNDGTLNGTQMGGDLMGEWARCNDALGVIEAYKKKGEHGDEAMLGASVYSGSYVVK